ncbi:MULTISPECIES: hypothetical protein [Pseudomonas]|uniref:Uncharacterized protein n=1 Tax=Pseudomonas tritici TaxID=2745518 RepID=A0A8I0CZI3_9PSED|nr:MULTISPECIES: hypothetical protein [Pseudomonas]MBP2870053.1 hypothetical protein [Pseudomonas sp. SWRI144]MBW8126719.1 hypothetical protein [Pseudomonas sp. LAP_36]MBW8135260.1 hypothetical protein [Pseudomonas sp. PAMC 26818]QXH81370.1 hypothetical protein HU722_0015175 [Pseudomonas tritici]CRL98067.1 hypothetical protein [Pseudomonas sp. 24 R 17]
METSTSQPWYNTRPAPVFMTVFYCTIVLLQAGLWVGYVGFPMVRMGDMSILLFINVCAVTLLTFAGGLMLLCRKKSNSLCFILALALGAVSTLSLLSSNSFGEVLSLPVFKEYALVFGIWIYSLQLRTCGYYDSKHVAS